MAYGSQNYKTLDCQHRKATNVPDTIREISGKQKPVRQYMRKAEKIFRCE